MMNDISHDIFSLKGQRVNGIKLAEAMLKDTENYPFIGDVINQLKIGRTAFYRYFATNCIKQLRKEHDDHL